MKKIIIVSIIGMSLVTTFVGNAHFLQISDISRAEWLVGTWENKTPRGSIFESWRKLNDQDFAGKSFMIKQNDTLIFESIHLIQKPDGLYYVPTVKDQNGGLPVLFKATSVSSKEMTFENPSHDFPQKIQYRKISSDSLMAEISGNDKGKMKSSKFPMRRVK